jgi:site-specific recombinase XerD
MVHKITSKKGSQNMITLRQAIEAYITTLKSEGMSKSYTSWLERRLRDFYLSVQGTGQNDVALGEVTLEDARRFIGFLLQKNTKYDHHHRIAQQMEGLSPTTIHGYARCIRSFGTFLYREGYTAEDIFAALKPPKVPKKIIEPFSEEEIRRILTVIPRETIEGLRNYTIFLLLLDTGIRLSEMLALKIEDIDFTESIFKVMGKVSKEREIPLGTTVRRAIIRYIQTARPAPLNANTTNLFLTMDGRPITQQTVAQIFRRIAKRAHLKHLYPHLLRHTFAVRFLINKGDAFSLQKILGHESLDMTRRYVELANTDIKKMHIQASPVDNLNLPDAGRGRPRRNLSNNRNDLFSRG